MLVERRDPVVDPATTGSLLQLHWSFVGVHTLRALPGKLCCVAHAEVVAGANMEGLAHTQLGLADRPGSLPMRLC